MNNCTVCGLELKPNDRHPVLMAGDCWPLCPVCAAGKKPAAGVSRRTLIRRLYAAGRSISACAVCGSGEGLEIHFLRPLAQGGGSGSANLLLLCPECHAKVHAGARILGTAVEVVRRTGSKENHGNER